MGFWTCRSWLQMQTQIIDLFIKQITVKLKHHHRLSELISFLTLLKCSLIYLWILWAIVGFLANKCNKIGESIVTIYIIWVFSIDMTGLWSSRIMMTSCVDRMLMVCLSEKWSIRLTVNKLKEYVIFLFTAGVVLVRLRFVHFVVAPELYYHSAVYDIPLFQMGCADITQLCLD